MRIRQIKPGWWLDKELRRGLSADAREFFIGLWMLADDDGMAPVGRDPHSSGALPVRRRRGRRPVLG